ncbi:MAG: hypothetical protein ACREJX_06360, partial [Polyangiaceae bacterium]
MKARASKKMLKRAARRSGRVIKQITPVAKNKVLSTSNATLSAIAGGAASLASLMGGVMAVAKSEIAHDLYRDLMKLRRREPSTATLVAVGAGIAAVVGGAAFFFGTERGKKLSHEAFEAAKPYIDRAKDTAVELSHGWNHSV